MTRDLPSWHAARERCAVFDLAAGFVVLSGLGRGPYLHALVTNKVVDLEEGQGRRAFALTPKGRVVADFLVCETGHGLWLECAGDSATPMMELLRKYYFGQEVEFGDHSDGWRALSLQGPESQALLERLGAPVPPGAPGANAGGSVADAPVRVARWSDTGEVGFHLWVLVGDRDDVRAALVEAGAEPGDSEAWTVLQIEAGVAAFGRELGEDTIPLEAPVEEAMSFDKGCYPGQEVIARLHVRGRPARFLKGLRIEGDAPLAPGDTLDAPEKPRAATVTASGVSPALGVVALAYVLRDFVDAGTRLTASDGRAAEVVDLPMIPVPTRAGG